MKTKLFQWVMLCFVFSIGMVFLLVGMSGIMKDTRSSFLRDFPPHPVLEGDTLNITYNSYYIAGGTPHRVYLGNYISPLHLLEVDLETLDTTKVSLRVAGIMDQKFWSVRVHVDSPYFFVSDGAVPRIYQGHVDTWEASRFAGDSIYFRGIAPIGWGMFALKTLGGFPRQNVLATLTSDYPTFRFTDSVLVKQVDGIFCTDGMLHTDPVSKQLIYVYHYRNDFFVLDTNLVVQLHGQTIDTTSTAKLTVATITSTDEYTLASPPLLVNKRSCVSGQRLFVNSGVLSRNQLRNGFDAGEVIDVYDLRNGEYAFSFYIYNFWENKRMTDVGAYGSRMVVLYGNILRVFSLRPRYFPMLD
jgi:hypothetical protein